MTDIPPPPRDWVSAPPFQSESSPALSSGARPKVSSLQSSPVPTSLQHSSPPAPPKANIPKLDLKALRAYGVKGIGRGFGIPSASSPTTSSPRRASPDRGRLPPPPHILMKEQDPSKMARKFYGDDSSREFESMRWDDPHHPGVSLPCSIFKLKSSMSHLQSLCDSIKFLHVCTKVVSIYTLSIYTFSNQVFQ
jgi:hypothetical protein